jgi:hypothetical protein
VHDLERLAVLVFALVRVVQAPRDLADDPRAQAGRQALAAAARGAGELREVCA